MNLIRSVVFAVMQTALTVFFSMVALFSFPFSAHTRYRMITGYNHIVIWLARVVLGIRYEVRGREIALVARRHDLDVAPLGLAFANRTQAPDRN